MPRRSIIPAADADAAMQLVSFAEQIAENADALGVPPAASRAALERARAFEAAFMAAISPHTRTSISIETKNRTRKEAERTIRALIRQIRDDPNVADADRWTLGLFDAPPSRPPRKVIPPPTVPPALHFVGMLGDGTHQLRAYNIERDHTAAKPSGIDYLSIHGCFHNIASPPAEVDVSRAVALGNARLIGTFPRIARITITPDMFHDCERGQFITYIARWSRTAHGGLHSPWSTPTGAVPVPTLQTG